MRNFFLLLKIRFQEKFDIGSNIVMLVLYLCLFAGVYLAASFLKTLGYAQALPLIAYVTAIILTFITTVIKINETFSGNEDSEFLLSMPFSSGVQVFVTFTMMFMSNLLICILIELPCYIVYKGTAFGAGFTVIRWLIGLFLTSLPVCGIAVMVGMVIILSLVKNPKKNQIVSAICLFFLCIAFSLMAFLLDRVYLAISGQLVYEATGTAAVGFVNEISQNFKLGRFYQLGIVEGNGLYTFLFIIMSLIWYAVLLFMHCMAYQGVITALRSPLSYGELSHDEIVNRMKERKLFTVLFAKEWNQLIRSKYYLLQSSIGIILGLVIPINFLIMGNMGLSNRPLIVPSLICLFAGCANTSYCSMSMEGKRYWIMESAPAPLKELKKAKILLYILLIVPIILFSAITMSRAFEMNGLWTAISLVIPIIYAAILALWGSFIGTKFADYSCETESMALHRGIPFILGYLPGIVIPAVLLVLSM